jgi:WD40 repeat protein
VAFSPDGKTVLTGSADNTARLWDGKGQPVGKPLQHQGPVTSVAFSHDGRTILTGSEDRMARLWDARTGEHSLAVFPHPGAITSVAFSPTDDKLVLTGSEDGTARLWDVPTPLEGEVERIVLWTRVITGQEIDDGTTRCVRQRAEFAPVSSAPGRVGGPPLP